MNNATIDWKYQSFAELSNKELYQLMAVRSKVFVVEQNCVYADADGKDLDCWHLSAWQDGQPVAYARIIPPGLCFTEASIGRVLTDPNARQTGMGRLLMQKAIEACFAQFNCTSIRIGAQYYLLSFYNSLGFSPDGETYLEDGIVHIEMLLTK